MDGIIPSNPPGRLGREPDKSGVMARIVPNYSAFGKRNDSRDVFKFEKWSQLFIRTHNVTLSVAMYINNPDRSPLGING